MMSSGMKRRRSDDEDEEMMQNQKLRSEYRELINDTKKNRLNYAKPGSTGLTQTLDKAEELFKAIRPGQCREAVLDSTLIKHCASLGVEQAKEVHANLISFESLAFADHLVGFVKCDRVGVGDNEDDDNEEVAPTGRRRPRIRHQLDWAKLGQHCQTFFRRRVPTVDLMYGPMALEVKERKAPQRRQAPRVSAKVEPQKLDSTDIHEEATTKEVDRIGKVLVAELTRAAELSEQTIEETSISYFDFVLNPTSFSQTIENIFHVSFLIKDGKVAINIEDDGLPYIHLMPQSTGSVDDLPRQQMILSLDMKEWQELVTALDLEEAAIPPRPS